MDSRGLEVDVSTLADQELVALYCERGLHEAFAVLVRRHQGRVFRFILRRVAGDGALAEELTHRVFITAAGKLGNVSSAESVGMWLLRVAHGTAVDEIRARQRRRERELALARREDVDPRSRYETQQAVRRVLGDLSEPERRALIAGDIGGRTMAELADVLSCSVSAAKMRLSRARMRFRGLYLQATF